MNKSDVFTVPINIEFVQELRESNSLDIFIMQDMTSENLTFQGALDTQYVFLKSETGMYRAVVDIEDFGCERDEVFSLNLSTTWFEFLMKKSITGETKIKVNDGLLKNKILDVSHYASFNNNNLKINIITNNESIHDMRTGKTYSVVLVEGLLIEDDSKSVYIGRQDQFPGSLLLAKDKRLIEKIVNNVT